jgi:hypothetical protein
MKHVTFEVLQDDSPMNPRDEFDHLSTFYGSSSHWLIGGKNDVNKRYSWDLSLTIDEFKREKAIIVEFESNAGTCYAVVERSQLKAEYLDHGYSMRKALYWARHCAQSEINEWLAYANGEVYGYIVKDNDGEHLDSCWGFYGYEFCKEEAKSQAEWHENEITTRLQQEEDELNRRMELATS